MFCFTLLCLNANPFTYLMRNSIHIYLLFKTIIVINIRKTEVCKTVHARLQVGEALGSPCPPHQVSVCIENARWIQAVGEGGSPFDSDSILETKTMRFGDNQNCV